MLGLKLNHVSKRGPESNKGQSDSFLVKDAQHKTERLAASTVDSQ